MVREDILKSQVEIFAGLWEKLLQSNKLNVCTKQLEGTTVLEVNILKCAGKNPDIILKEISSLLNVPSSTLTSAINRLEKRKLIKRVISERDLRSFGLVLTEAGETALKAHYEQLEQLINEMLNSFNEKERSDFIRLFEKLTEHIMR